MNIAILLLSGGVVQRGAEVGMHMLAEDLAQLGHEVHVYQAGKAISHQPSAISHLHYHQINLPLSPHSHKPTTLIGKILERLYLDRRGLLTLLFSFKWQVRLLRISHPMWVNNTSGVKPYDILFPVDGFWEILASKLIQKIKGGKIVVSGKAGPGWTDAHNLKLKPDLFVPISNTAESWAKTIRTDVPLHTIGEAIDLKLFNPQVKPAQINLKSPVVVTVAAFTKYKRVDLVIQAVAQTSNLSLLVVGRGEEEDNLRQLGQQLLGDRFELRHADYQELPALYAACDVFTLASEPQEAFGRVLLEAQASGLPIVTTDDPLRRWMVGDTGFFVNPTDTQAYAQALEQATKQSQPAKGVQNAKRFSREHIAKEYDTMFRQLV